MAAFDDMLEDLGRRFPAASPGRFLVMSDWRQVGSFVLTGANANADLEHLHVEKAHRRRGVGSQALRAICAAADRRQVDLELLVVPQLPDLASSLVALYRRHRFFQLESDVMLRFAIPLAHTGPLPCPANEDRAPRVASSAP
jgi:GNAT superfamily N-acetyltransferase